MRIWKPDLLRTGDEANTNRYRYLIVVVFFRLILKLILYIINDIIRDSVIVIKNIWEIHDKMIYFYLFN